MLVNAPLLIPRRRPRALCPPARVGPVRGGHVVASRQVVYGAFMYGLRAHVPRRRLRLMRLPSLTKLHVHPCHYGAVVHPA